MQFIITITVVILLVGVASSCPSVCRCQAGELVDCSRRRMDSIPTDLPDNTYSLDLDYNAISVIKNNTFNNLPNLRSLSLEGNAISVIEDNTFKNLQNLKYLYLQNNNISEIEDNAFNNLPNLLLLNMQSNPISFVSENAFENLPRLTSLKLDMHCGYCNSIAFWKWIKLHRKFANSTKCYDYDGEQLSKLQLNNVTGCFTCVNGRYGPNCSQDCSNNCYNNTCHIVSGVCLSGCRKGWMGTYCIQPCSKGHFGNNCNETCDGCISELCNSSDGVCDIEDICKAGWYGVKCEKACSKGLFGNNCNEACDGCISELCNSSDGVCDIEDICKAGWYGLKCNKGCMTGRYGVNCDSHCITCTNRICDRQNGHCTYGCVEGYKGDGCHLLADNYTAVYTGVGGFLVTALVAGIVFATLRYRRKSEYENSTFGSGRLNIGAQMTARDEGVVRYHPYETIEEFGLSVQ